MAAKIVYKTLFILLYLMSIEIKSIITLDEEYELSADMSEMTEIPYGKKGASCCQPPNKDDSKEMENFIPYIAKIKGYFSNLRRTTCETNDVDMKLWEELYLRNFGQPLFRSKASCVEIRDKCNHYCFLDKYCVICSHHSRCKDICTKACDVMAGCTKKGKAISAEYYNNDDRPELT